MGDFTHGSTRGDVIEDSAPPLAAQTPSEPRYVLGHSPEEIHRLTIQAAVLRPITERTLRSAGLAPGMRVLDVGCGAGDVSMLAAELVGPSGSVVAIDRNPQVLRTARSRAANAGFSNIEFKDAAVETFSDTASFDCVTGRYVLIHQSDPVAFLRAVTRFLRKGGVVALHEIEFRHSREGYRRVPLWDLTVDIVVATAIDGFASHDAGTRMYEHFLDAGLPGPDMFCEIPLVYGPDSPTYEWMAASIHSLLPQLVRMGLLSDEATVNSALKSRLRDAIVTARRQVAGSSQICGWARM